MILKLAYYGNPVLRKKANPIETITPQVKKLIDDMIETMESQRGLGLAAPQVHHPLALFIVSIPQEDEEKNILPGRLLVFVNPKIVSYSEESWVHNEGCLSIPKVYEDVERPLTITVEALDREGKPFSEVFTGWEARAILHENDHINGVLFIDRVKGNKRKQLDPLLRDIKKRYTGKGGA